MEYLEFERILSTKRMQRYKEAANSDTSHFSYDLSGKNYTFPIKHS